MAATHTPDSIERRKHILFDKSDPKMQLSFIVFSRKPIISTVDSQSLVYTAALTVSIFLHLQLEKRHKNKENKY